MMRSNQLNGSQVRLTCKEDKTQTVRCSTCGVQPPRTYSSPCRLTAQWQASGKGSAVDGSQWPPALSDLLSTLAVTTCWWRCFTRPPAR